MQESSVKFLQNARHKADKCEALMGRIFIMLLMMLVLLVVVDVASRPFISSRSAFEKKFPTVSSRYPHPYVMFSGKPNADRFNRLGYVGPVPRMPKPQEEIRIIFLGGSTLVNGDPTIPALVQDYFQADGLAQVKTYNFGVISSVSTMELVKLIHEVVEYDPDIVVMYNGGNDLTQPYLADPRPGHPFNYNLYEYNPLLESTVEEYPAFMLFAYGSNILRALFARQFADRFVDMKKLRLEVGYDSEKWRQEIADIYAGNIQKAAKVSQAYDIRFAAFFQPMVFFKEQKKGAEMSYASENLREPLNDLRQRTLQKIEQARTQDSINIFDLSGLFGEETDTVYTDFIHVKQEYKPVIARQIYHWCRSVL
jgi:lysophospholipase L1-like esterase